MGSDAGILCNPWRTHRKFLNDLASRRMSHCRARLENESGVKNQRWWNSYTSRHFGWQADITWLRWT